VNPSLVNCLMSYTRHQSTIGGRKAVGCAAISYMTGSHQESQTNVGSSKSAGPAFSPLYQQIKNLMLRSLQDNEWGPGEAIPSEMELAARFRVSQGTVRKAVDELAADNLLVRRQGKGTFVATHAEQKVQYRFLRLAADDGDAIGAQRRFIDCRRLRAPAEIARALGLKAGDAVLQVRRVLSFRDVPVVLDDIWLPGVKFKGLTAERLSDYRGPMYGLFETEFGVRMIRAEEKIRAVAADEVASSLLGVAVGAPLLSVERLSLSYGDEPVELRRGLYNTAAHHYRNELS
jgi:GntR family transcriptional regulator